MSIKKKQSVVILWILLGGIPLNAQDIDPVKEYSDKAIEKPRAPRPSLQVKTHTYIVDGADRGTDMRLYGNGFGFVMPPTNAWRVTDDGYSSAVFSFYVYPEVEFSLCTYGETEFVPNINPSSLRSYLEGLRRKFENDLTVLNMDRDFQLPVRGPKPLNREFRVVEYTIRDKGTNALNHYVEFFVPFKDKLLVASLKGPQNRTKSARESFQDLLFNIVLEEEY